MNYKAAIDSLRDGQAAKPITWGGYVKREDVSISAYSPTSSYTVGSQVTNNGSVYECVVATPNPAGTFDPAKWERLNGRSHQLIFRERDNSGSAPVDHVVTRTVTRTGTTAAVAGTFLQDGQLFEAQLSDDWIIGDAELFERARTGGSGKW